jgi:lipoprotein signal peptidase
MRKENGIKQIGRWVVTIDIIIIFGIFIFIQSATHISLWLLMLCHFILGYALTNIGIGLGMAIIGLPDLKIKPIHLSRLS